MHLLQLRRAVDYASLALALIFLLLSGLTAWLVGKSDHVVTTRETSLVRAEVAAQWRLFMAEGDVARAMDVGVVVRRDENGAPDMATDGSAPWLKDFFARSAVQSALFARPSLPVDSAMPVGIALTGSYLFVAQAPPGPDGADAYRLRPFALEDAAGRLGADGLKDIRLFKDYRPESAGGALVLSGLGGRSGGLLVWSSPRLGAQQGKIVLPLLATLAAIAAGLIVFLRIEHRHERDVATAAIEEARHLASFDPLTGLSNRRALFEHLGSRAPSTEHFEPLAVMLIDLDRFKWINDTHGHSAGDEALVGVANVLRAILGNEVCVARTGGDEFVAVISSEVSPKMAMALGDRLLEGLAADIRVNGRHLPVYASIGVAMGPQHAKDGRDLLALADLAAYSAKAAGRNRTLIYDPSISAERRFQRSLARELKGAIVSGEIVLLYQPIISVEEKRIVGVEALARWDHPVRGLLPPSEFIHVAEQSELITRLGNHVIEYALSDLGASGTLRISVNVTGRQLLSDGFVEFVAGVLARTRVAGDRLTLEVTETSLLLEQPRLIEVMEKLRALGVTFAIDDFGVAYSSLNYLLLFKFNILKVDRQFVSAIETSEDGATIVKAVASLARSLGMSVVGEGVETERQRRFLEAAGCHYIQGYLTGRPMTRAALKDVLQAEARTFDVRAMDPESLSGNAEAA